MDKIKFSTLDLKLGDDHPSLEDLKQIFASLENWYEDEDNDTYYLIEKDVSIDEKYFWLYFKYGKTKPRTDNIFNIETHKERPNDRSKDDIEMKNQLFILYDMKYEYPTLYLSDLNKKSLIKSYLEKYAQKTISINNIYGSVEEFNDKIDDIRKIEFITRENIFNIKDISSKEFERQREIFALDGSAEYEVRIKLKTRSNLEKLKKVIGLGKAVNAKKLICVGYDDNNVESVLNANYLMRKIDIEVYKDNQGLYNSSEIKEKLIARIRG